MKFSTSEITKLKKAAELIKQSRQVVAFTGAGISTPSGIPDFRSAGSGLWNKYNPMQVSSLTAFNQRPDLFFDWLHGLVEKIHLSQPNPAHFGLAKLEEKGFLKAIITQNIDDLHHRAGSKNVLELHGSLRSATCPKCNKTYLVDEFLEDFLQERRIPRCSACESNLKPDIVLFEEYLPASTWEQAYQYCQTCDLMIVIGSSLEVFPAASIPQTVAERQKPLIIINKTTTHLHPSAVLTFSEDLAVVVPEITKQIIPDKTCD